MWITRHQRQRWPSANPNTVLWCFLYVPFISYFLFLFIHVCIQNTPHCTEVFTHNSVQKPSVCSVIWEWETFFKQLRHQPPSASISSCSKYQNHTDNLIIHSVMLSKTLIVTLQRSEWSESDQRVIAVLIKLLLKSIIHWCLIDFNKTAQLEQIFFLKLTIFYHFPSTPQCLFLFSIMAEKTFQKT